ncbi:MAG: TetR/AcrR family transcriptional regulator [Methanoregula sp.]|nr:TetR/AcrR family transcriptional regulator [Methanoregula sp.]MDD5187113.1 TetR/AcrR family transcriptional regulator [Methanoregula sp.]
MTVAERKQREKEQRRVEIINAAEKLFFSRGYDSVSVEDIAKEADLSKGTLFVYFINKEDLFFAVVLRGTEILSSMFEESINERGRGNKINRGPSRAYFEFVKKYPDYHRIISYYQSGRFDPEKIAQNETARKIADLRKEIFLMLEDAVKNDIGCGTFRTGVKPVEIVVLLTVIAEGIAAMRPDLQEALKIRGVTPDQFLSDVIDLEHFMLMNNGQQEENAKGL